MLNLSGSDYAAEWKTIDSLAAQGLPKSALEKTEALYERAKRDNNPSQIIKTLIYRGRFQSELEEYGLVQAIDRLEQEVETADFPVKSILNKRVWNFFF